MRNRRPALAALLLTGALLAAGVAAPTAASADPLVGGCFNYPAKTLTTTSSPAPVISCDATHTAETYYVRTLPASFGVPSKASLGAKISAGKPCTVSAVNAYVGMPDRALPSRFLSVQLFPTDAQWAAGERWMRCDVVLQGGLELKKFVGTAAGLVAKTPPAIFNFCTPREPNAVATAAYPCTDPKKNWIKVLDKELGGAGSKFPGTTSVEKSTRNLCEKMGKKYDGKVPYPGWWAIWPTSRGWKEGRRSAQCFVPYGQYLKELAQNAPKPPKPSPTPTLPPMPAPSPAPTIDPQPTPVASPAPSV
jgi:hypothetical protein